MMLVRLSQPSARPRESGDPVFFYWIPACVAVKKTAVIPGRREAANPESITTGLGAMDSGSRPLASAGMTDVFSQALARE
jgi:hypothetical protein